MARPRRSSTAAKAASTARIGSKVVDWVSPWLSSNESKRDGELFLLLWQPFWLIFFGGVVITGVYKEWGDVGYTLCGLTLSAPLFLVPIFWPVGEADSRLPWHKRFAVKANVYFGVVNFVGNYFWTHYFFVCLGASYTFPVTWKLNEIPLGLFGITQSYFSLYYVFSSIIIRRLRKYVREAYGNNTWVEAVAVALAVAVMSWTCAFMETWTIESVPYYSFDNREAMYRIGVTFYALYFVPSFPMYFWLDEEKHESWTLWRTFVDAMGSSMIVFVLCDFWRLWMSDYMASIIGVAANATRVPFVYK